MARSVIQQVNAQIRREVGRLTKAQAEVSKVLAEALSELAEEILTESNETCPYETGELRNSARAYLKRGSRAERVAWVEGASSSGGGTVKIGGTAGLTAAHRWELDIYYSRMKGSFDVALFTHENISPHGGTSPAARQEGTGPKYLENAYNNRIRGFEERLRQRIDTSLVKFGYG